MPNRQNWGCKSKHLELSNQDSYQLTKTGRFVKQEYIQSWATTECEKDVKLELLCLWYRGQGQQSCRKAEGSLSNHIVTEAVMVEMESENNFFLLLGSPVSVADLKFVLSCQPLHAFMRCSWGLPLIQGTLLHKPWSIFMSGCCLFQALSNTLMAFLELIFPPCSSHVLYDANGKRLFQYLAIANQDLPLSPDFSKYSCSQ